MKKFISFINEEVMPTAFLHDSSIDIEKDAVRQEINGILSHSTAMPCVTPYAALRRVSKALAYFHIYLPKKSYMEGDRGVEVYEIKQFGERMGFTDQGEWISHVPAKFHLVFRYRLMGASFYVSAKIVDKEGLDKELDQAEAMVSEARKVRSRKVSPPWSGPDRIATDNHMARVRKIAQNAMQRMSRKKPVKEGFLDSIRGAVDNAKGAIAKSTGMDKLGNALGGAAQAAPKPDMRIMGNPDTQKKTPKDGSANSAFPANEETINEISHKLALKAMKKSEKRADDEWEADYAHDRLSDWKTHDTRAHRLRGHMRRKFGNKKIKTDGEDRLGDGGGEGRTGVLGVNTHGKRAGLPPKEQVNRLKSNIKFSLGKHHKPNLPEETQLDELSKNTLKSYIKKAALSASAEASDYNRLQARTGLKGYATSSEIKRGEKHIRKHHNRHSGINKAVDRLEETQLDEISKGLVKRYKKAAESDKRSAESSAETSHAHRKNRALPLAKRNAFHDEEKWLKGIAKKREKGIAMADKRLDEISAKLVGKLSNARFAQGKAPSKTLSRAINKKFIETIGDPVTGSQKQAPKEKLKSLKRSPKQ